MEQSKNQDKPFLAFVSTNTPHWPFFAKPEDIKAVRKAFEKSSIAKKDIPSYHGKEGLIKYTSKIELFKTTNKFYNPLLPEFYNLRRWPLSPRVKVI